jgi:hypothetical protein
MTMVSHYSSAAQHLAGGRNRDSRPVENNTRVERRGDDFAIRLHETDVAVIHPDDSITLNSGGWLTVTTKDRMNRALGSRSVRIASDRGAWFIYRGWQVKVCRYFDGITISESGEILNPRSESLEERIAFAEEKMVRSINRYIDGYFEAMEAGKMELPSGGDCWDCSMIVDSGPDKGKPLGDVKDGSDHLLSHIKDRYYVPSLLWNAVRARGYGDPNFVMGMRLDRESYEFGLMKVSRAYGPPIPDPYAVKELRRDLRKYLAKRLLKTRAH